MGAWGEKAFENDSALDWLADLEAEGVDALRDLLASVADTDDEEYLDVDDGAAAIAAAEIVAAARGRGRDRLTKEVIGWLDDNASDLVAEDLVLACRAVERVVAGSSELRELWEEGGSDSPWHADVRTLLTRLGSTIRIGGPQRAHEKASETEKQALLTFLHARGLEPTKEQLARIVASENAAEVRGWLARALLAPSVGAVLDG
ncbi:MAG TPA: DUF4259 domain-containing protein [Labilithrix sp.]|nr:DUF4259 domain-containing protein [Labilithrix sp.]